MSVLYRQNKSLIVNNITLWQPLPVYHEGRQMCRTKGPFVWLSVHLVNLVVVCTYECTILIRSIPTTEFISKKRIKIITVCLLFLFSRKKEKFLPKWGVYLSVLSLRTFDRDKFSSKVFSEDRLFDIFVSLRLFILIDEFLDGFYFFSEI